MLAHFLKKYHNVPTSNQQIAAAHDSGKEKLVVVDLIFRFKDDPTFNKPSYSQVTVM